MNKIKILIIARPLDSQDAGIHVYSKNLICFLDKYGDHNAFEYTILRNTNRTPILLKNIKEVFIENQFNIPFFNALRLFLLIPHFARKNKSNVVIDLAHFGPFNLPKKIKRVTVIHDLTPIIMSEFHVFTSSILQKLFLPRILKRASLIISNSKNTEKDIRKVYPKIDTPVSTIHLGVDTSQYHQIEKNRDDISRFNLKKYFFFLGTLEPRKNLGTLLKAYEIFRDLTNEDIELVIGGKQGWKNNGFLKLLEKSKYKADIKRIGYVELNQLPALYANCEAFVYPSVYEGFGLPVIEALSCGAQVICAQNSSLTEFGNELVTYFDTYDPESLAEMLSMVLINKKNIDQAKLKAKYSWENYIRKFEKSLDQII